MNNVTEFGFFELLQILFRRKWLFMSVVVSVLILGVLFSAVAPKRYQYSQIIELSTYGDWGQPQLINTSAYMVARLNNIIIPEVVAKHDAFAVEASDVKNDKGLVQLTITDSGNSLPTVRKIFAAILANIQSFEKPAFDMHKRLQQTNLEKVEREIKLRERLNRAISTAATGNVASSQITSLQLSSLLFNEYPIAHPGALVRQKTNLVYFKPSHFALTGVQVHHAGFSTKIVALLFLLLAFITGFLVVLFVEFLTNMREKK